MGFAGLAKCVISSSAAALPILPAIAYSRRMPIDAATLRTLIENELTGRYDARVIAQVRGALVEPYVVHRTWPFREPGHYPSWTVLEDQRSERAIAYRDDWHRQWGIVGSGTNADPGMGDDSNWFSTFLDAFAALSRMPADAATLRKLIDHELDKVQDARVVERVRGRLVDPYLVSRRWDYGEPGLTHPCWTVLEDPGSNSAIAYSEHGFGPRCPWGLVGLSGDAKTLSMGMDSGWFTTFMDAFVGSFAAAGLPIWGVCKIDVQGGRTFLTDEGMSDDAAFQKAQEFRASDPAGTYSIGLVDF